MTGSSSGAVIYRVRAIALAAAVCAIFPLRWAGAEDSRASDPAVTVAQVKKRCFKNEIQVTGVLAPRREVVVRPDKDGKISEIPAEVGDTVKSDQVLARLSPLDGQGKDMEVKAPAAGIVTFKSPVAFVGSFASAKDGPPLFQIAKDGEMELVGNTSVETLQKLEPNKSASAKITVVGMFDRQLDSKVRLLSSTINPMTQLGQVHLTVANDPRLRVGAFGLAMINLGESCNPAVPLSAVLYAPGGSVVQVVYDGRVQTRKVRVGLLDATHAEILDKGLSEGEMVIAKAGAFFRDDDHVRAIAASENSTR
jgi:HlyD family secretion protein